MSASSARGQTCVDTGGAIFAYEVLAKLEPDKLPKPEISDDDEDLPF
jgi:hypothetical protein